MRKSTYWCRVTARLSLILLPLWLIGCGAEDSAVERRVAYGGDGAALVPVARPASPPNLIVIVLDALRHDALPLGHGQNRDVRMPHLASLASRGVAYSNAVAAAPWTLPSMTSLLTGLQPSAHGLYTPQPHVRLVDAITTWAEILENTYDYETVAHTAGPWFTGSGATVLQGFGTKASDFSLRDAPGTIQHWSRMRASDRPFFLLLHTFDVHDPYGEANHPWRGQDLADPGSDPRVFVAQTFASELFRHCYTDEGMLRALTYTMGASELSRRLQRYAHAGYAESPRPELADELRAAYWEGVRWADGLLGQTITCLESEGLLENSLLVVMSDHGEAFGEHGGLAHGRILYDELVRVPMVMAGPAPFEGGQVITSPIGLVDVLPTFFEWAGLEAHVGIEGRSQLALFDADQGCRPVLSEERLSYLNTGEPGDAIRLSARTEQWKYILTYDTQTRAAHEEVYDLLIDPQEIDDLGAGTGRLPPELVFDDCFCEAVNALRERIWDRQTQPDDEAYAVPYGVSNQRPSTPPPAACRGHVD